MRYISTHLRNILKDQIQSVVDGGIVTDSDGQACIDNIDDVIEYHVPTNEKVRIHAETVEELTELYESKNNDYGDSFGIGMKKYGMVMPLIRMQDKLNRLSSLVSGTKQKVNDQSVRDTLLDLANYAIMTVVQMEYQKIH